MSEAAKEWFTQNYHTPQEKIPVLLGVHDDGQEEWEHVPIEVILQAYADQHLKEKLEEGNRFTGLNNFEKDALEWLFYKGLQITKSDRKYDLYEKYLKELSELKQG